MQSRHIIIIALLQMGALAFGILFTAVFAKFGQDFSEQYPHLRMPVAFYMALLFKDFGVALMALVLGWTVFAAHYSSGSPKCSISSTALIGSGVGLILFLLVLGACFCVMSARQKTIKQSMTILKALLSFLAVWSFYTAIGAPLFLPLLWVVFANRHYIPSRDNPGAGYVLLGDFVLHWLPLTAAIAFLATVASVYWVRRAKNAKA